MGSQVAIKAQLSTALAAPAAGGAAGAHKVAVGLCRCSTDMQDHSIKDQEAEIVAFCAKEKLQLVGLFKDEGISGSKIDRPGLNALRAFLATSPLKGTVVVWKRDRLVRPEDPLDGLLLEREIRVARWKIHYLAGSNAVGNPLVDSILGLVEHHAGGEYLRKLSQDSLRGQLRRVLSGEVPGAKIPYGYAKQVLDGSGKLLRTIPRGEKHRKMRGEVTRLVPGDAAEIDIVRWMFSEYAGGLKSLNKLAEELNARQITGPGGGVWRSASIHELLENGVYVGDRVWNKESSAKFFRLKSGEIQVQDAAHPSRTTGQTINYAPNGAEDHVVIPDKYPALVSREVFDRVQAVVRQRAEAFVGSEGVGGRWSQRCYVLTGLVYCANCGHRMTAIPTVSRGKQYHRYLCSGYQQARVCMPYWFAADVLERAVIQRLKQHLRLGEHPVDQLRPILVKAIQAQVGGPLSSLDQAALKRERGKLERQVEQALTNLAVVPAEIATQLGEKIKGWQARVAEIDRAVAAARDRTQQKLDVDRAADEAMAMIDQLDRLTEDVSREERRAFFLRAVERIELKFETQAPRAGGKHRKHRFVEGTIRTCAQLSIAGAAMGQGQIEPVLSLAAPPGRATGANTPPR